MKIQLNKQEATLANGMKVVLIHKPDYEKSFFLIGVPAGGMNILEEKNGESFQNRTGVAHFLEHQMFRLNGEDVTDAFALMQAQTNAYTSYTETVYYFTTTADPKAPLALLMDFVQTLDVDEKSVNKEKGIILSEYSIYDQQPEQQLMNQTLLSLYENHPLRQEILGTPQDIQEMSVQDLKTFYQTNYDPSRLILIGITGRDPKELMDFIQEHEKAYPSIEKTQVKRIYGQEKEEVCRPFYTRKMEVSKPYIAIAYKLKPVQGVLNSLMVDTAVSLWLDTIFGPMNPEYQKWLDAHIISQAAGCEGDFSEDHAYILFYAQTRHLQEFKQIVQKIVKNPHVDPEAFKAMRIQYLARSIRTLDQFENLGLDLMRSYMEGYDYLEAMNLVRDLTVEQVNEILAGLDFSHETITEIHPLSE